MPGTMASTMHRTVNGDFCHHGVHNVMENRHWASI